MTIKDPEAPEELSPVVDQGTELINHATCDATANQVATWVQAIKSMTDALNTAILTLVEAVANGIQRVIEYATELVNKLVTSTNNLIDELSGYIKRQFETLESEGKGIVSEVDKLTPFLAVAKPPSDIDDVVGWLSNLVSAVVSPQIKAGYTYTQQASALSGCAAKLTTELTESVSELGEITFVSIPEGFEIELPALSVPIPFIDIPIPSFG